jgi:hypothetical protein
MAITQLHQQRLQDQTINSSMARQALNNGNFDVWQRGTTGSSLVDITSSYLADHWLDYADDNGGTLPTLTRSRQLLTSGDIPNAFYYSRLATNGAGTSLGVSSIHNYVQRIENGTRILCGNGKKVTVSFWAKSDISNKKIGVYLLQYYGSTGSPSSVETITGTNWTLTTSWTKYTYTFTTNTLVGKTFGTDNNDYIALNISYIWGTTTDVNVGATTAETYVGSGNIDIAQVQLCAGDEALPFEPKSYLQELADCQRYHYQVFNTSGTANPWGIGYHTATNSTAVYIGFPTTMRIIPTTLAYSNLAVSQAGVGRVNVTSASIDSGDATGIIIACTTAGGLTAGQGSIGTFQNGTTNYIALSAEL